MEPKQAKAKKFRSTIVGVGCTFLYYAYLPIIKSAMEVFDCSPTVAGVEIMNSAPEIVCDGEEYNKLVGLSVVSLFVYGFGIPLFFAQTILRHRKAIKLEQIMKESEDDFMGDINATQTTRMRYRSLFSLFSLISLFLSFSLGGLYMFLRID